MVNLYPFSQKRRNAFLQNHYPFIPVSVEWLICKPLSRDLKRHREGWTRMGPGNTQDSRLISRNPATLNRIIPRDELVPPTRRANMEFVQLGHRRSDRRGPLLWRSRLPTLHSQCICIGSRLLDHLEERERERERESLALSEVSSLSLPFIVLTSESIS